MCKMILRFNAVYGLLVIGQQSHFTQFPDSFQKDKICVNPGISSDFCDVFGINQKSGELLSFSSWSILERTPFSLLRIKRSIV